MRLRVSPGRSWQRRLGCRDNGLIMLPWASLSQPSNVYTLSTYSDAFNLQPDSTVALPFSLSLQFLASRNQLTFIISTRPMASLPTQKRTRKSTFFKTSFLSYNVIFPQNKFFSQKIYIVLGITNFTGQQNVTYVSVEESSSFLKFIFALNSNLCSTFQYQLLFSS